MTTTTYITTTSHNIGDDFVREGLIHLLEQAGVKGKNLFVHKHSPITATYGLEWIRKNKISKHLTPITKILRLKNRIDDADLLIQSGAPIYWCHPGESHCSTNEWFEPLIKGLFINSRRNRKFFNLGGGSCQTYFSDGSEFLKCEKCLSYIKELYDICDLTILRDALAQNILSRTGRHAKVLPCPSIFAKSRFGFNSFSQGGDYIVLNFMENGGHFTFGQKIDSLAWETAFKQLVSSTEKMGKVVIACHTKEESSLAARIAPSTERFLIPNDHVGFIKFYSRAKWGILNRVHGAFMLASFGKPAAVIGSDSRARMIENLKLPSYYVNDVPTIGVDTIIDAVLSKTKNYHEEIQQISTTAQQNYFNELSTHL